MFTWKNQTTGKLKKDPKSCVSGFPFWWAEVDSWEIAPTFKELLLNTSIQFLRDTVKSVQPSNAVNGKPFLATSDRDVGGTVYLGSGTEVEYDW